MRLALLLAQTWLEALKGVAPVALVPLSMAVASAATWLATQRRQSKTDSITELSAFIDRLKLELKDRDVEIATREADSVRCLAEAGKLRVQVATLVGEVRMLEGTTRMLGAGADPLLVNQFMNPVGYLIIDSLGMIERVGPNIVPILHYSEDELVGRNVERIIPVEFRAAHRLYMAKAVDPVTALDPRNRLAIMFITREGDLQPVWVRVERWAKKGPPHFTVYVQQRDEGDPSASQAELAVPTPDPSPLVPLAPRPS